MCFFFFFFFLLQIWANFGKFVKINPFINQISRSNIKRSLILYHEPDFAAYVYGT